MKVERTTETQKERPSADNSSLCSLRLCGQDSGSGFPGLDFNLVAVSEKLSAEAKGFPLQGQVDEFQGLPGLLLGGTCGDLPGVELEVDPADGDGFHGRQG